MMLERDNEAIPARYPHLTQHFIDIQQSGVLAAYAAKLRDIGQQLNVPVDDVHKSWEELASRGVDTTSMPANGLNHPDANGHGITAEILIQVVIDNS
jgi:hypothetical protein